MTGSEQTKFDSSALVEQLKLDLIGSLGRVNQCIQGDVLEILPKLIEDRARPKVNCVVTSPPYWGLRDYGVAGQLGLEPTLEEYVEKLVEVFALISYMLADDGTIWLNLGDTSSSGFRANNTPDPKYPERQKSPARKRPGFDSGLPAKNLLGIPWRVAFALQNVGWILRSDIIWHKPNPMAHAHFLQPQQPTGAGSRPGDTESGRPQREFDGCGDSLRMADAESLGGRAGLCDCGTTAQRRHVAANGGGLADADRTRLQERTPVEASQKDKKRPRTSSAGELADPVPAGRPARRTEPGNRPSAVRGGVVGLADPERESGRAEHEPESGRRPPSPADAPELGRFGQAYAPGPTMARTLPPPT